MIVYGIFDDFIVLIHIDHHDKVYLAADVIAKALVHDESLLETLRKVGITPEEFAAFIESIGR